MPHIHFRSLITVTALTIVAYATAQDNAITNRFNGNCGLHLSDSGFDVHTEFPKPSLTP